MNCIISPSISAIKYFLSYQILSNTSIFKLKLYPSIHQLTHIFLLPDPANCIFRSPVKARYYVHRSNSPLTVCFRRNGPAPTFVCIRLHSHPNFILIFFRETSCSYTHSLLLLYRPYDMSFIITSNINALCPFQTAPFSSSAASPITFLPHHL